MTAHETRKELVRYLLQQVKLRSLDVEVAKRYIATLAEQAPATPDPEPVAVVGIACRFPGAGDKEQFWDNLMAGRESISDFPDERLADFRRIEPGEGVLRRGGYLDQVDQFDADFFGVTPQTALQMDPYHRILMEVLVEAGEDAGYPRSALYGSNTAVFVGNDHTHRLSRSYLQFLSDVDFAAITGSWSCILASRLSYLFNLRGPASVIDTGCSSGLVALDAAMKSLRAGDCDAAFVAAINLFFDPSAFGDETSSPEFRVRAFDDAADGTVWSEGVAGILVKSLSRAMADGDHMYGVVRAVATNSDGRSNGLTAPNAQAQAELLERAWEMAGVSPETISYIEAHGTGTVLGDPIEIKGLKAAFEQFTKRRQFCALGSVKSNIGHTVGAAGLASLVKVLLCLENAALPPSINFDVPNRYLDLADSPVYLADQATVWEAGPAPRRAGASSFSLGGTNAHVVVEEAPTVAREPWTAQMRIYPVSGRSVALRADTAARHRAYLATHPAIDLDDACYTMQACRDHQSERAVILFSDRDALLSALTVLADPAATSISGPGWVVLCEEGEVEVEPALAGGLATARAFLAGSDDAFDVILRSPAARRVPLPVTAFDRKRYWDETPRALATATRSLEDSKPALLDALQGPSRIKGDPSPSAPRRVAALAWTEVLGYPEVSAEDHFFTLGGDSISSLKMTALINDAFGLEIPTTVLLDHPRFGDFASVLVDVHGLTDECINGATLSCRAPLSVEDAYELPLTPGQRSVFLSAEVLGDSLAYNVTGVTVTEGHPPLDQVRNCMAALVRRHDSLRATFHLVDGQPVQRIHAEVPIDLEVRSLPAPPSGVTRDEAALEALGDFSQPFDLGAGPLFRVVHLQFADGWSCTAVDVHHLVTDGTSMGILMRDFAALSAGETLPPLAIGYCGAVEDAVARLSSPAMAEHRAYWVGQYADTPPVLHIATDAPRPAIPTNKGATWFSEIDSDLLGRAQAFASRHELTLNMLLLSAFHLLLSRMSGQDDIVIGTPTLGRSRASQRDVVGMFVNTLPLRLICRAGTPLGGYLSELRSSVLDALKHQEFPFESLIEIVNPPREHGRRALVDVYFVHQNSDMGLDGETEQALRWDAGTSKFDITLSTRVSNGRLLVSWEYAVPLFSEATIQLYDERFSQFLESIVSSADDADIADLNVIGPRERDLLNQWGQAHDDRWVDSGLVPLFEETVDRNPKAIALIMNESQMTYAELDRRANRIARGLRAAGITSGPVALLLDRSFDLVATMWGVLKAGAHYVPINTEFPAERVRLMLDDCGAPILLSTGACWKQAQTYATPERQVLDVSACADMADSVDRLEGPYSAQEPVYVMYTSGTTGTPKGSVIPQQAVLRISHQNNFYQASADDVFVMLSDYSFDGSVFDMYSALLNGGKLLILEPSTVWDPDQLAEKLHEHQVTCFFVTVSLFNTIIDRRPDAFSKVRRVMFGGEAASPTHVARAYEVLGPGRISQVYGPTETTVYASAHTIVSDDPVAMVSIGRAVTGTTLWILDEAGRQQPIGATGELYIGGRGLADGYLNQPELTAERFVAVPGIPEPRLYRTGDLVMFRSDGLLYFVGRRDDQIKLRGFRIELGEIMNAALQQPGVAQAFASTITVGGGKALCLWVRLEEDEPGGLDRVKDGLARRLPAFMVPSILVPIDGLPLNKNGKVDIKALPMPDLGSSEGDAPSTDEEKLLARAWTAVLGVPVHDVRANFFSLGGDSIKAIQVVARLREDGVAIEVPDVLEHQTVAELAEYLATTRQGTSRETYDQTPHVGPLGATPIQRAYLDQPGPGGVFNQSLRVTPPMPVPADDLLAAVEALVRAHDMLRVRVTPEGGLVVREPTEEGLVASIAAGPNSSAEDEQRFLGELQELVDVVDGPAVALATGLGRDGAGFALAIHHLAVDVISWGVLLDDLERCLAGGVDAIPARTLSYPRWAQTLREHAESGGFWRELGYWRRSAMLASREPAPFDQPTVRRGDTELSVITINADDTQKVLAAGQDRSGATPDQVVLAAVVQAVSEIRGVPRVAVTVERHGRDPLGEGQDLSRTVGWFTTTYPLVVDVGDALDATIAAVRRAAQRIPGKGRGFEALRLFGPGLDATDAELLASLRPQVSFNYLGDQDETGGTGLRVEHLSAEFVIAADHPMHVLDVVAYRRNGELRVEVRLPRGGLGREFEAAFRANVAAVVVASDDSDEGLGTAVGLESHVLDAVLSDLVGPA